MKAVTVASSSIINWLNNHEGSDSGVVINHKLAQQPWRQWQWRRRRRFWHATLRLRSAIRRHHPPQRAVLSQICCFGSVRWCCFRSCWMVLSHVMRGRPGCLLQSARGEANRILLAPALSSMRIICPNRVSRSKWIIAVSLGCFVSLRTSSFRTNWYHLMPSSIRRHHWSRASILCTVSLRLNSVTIMSRGKCSQCPSLRVNVRVVQ